MVALCGRSLKGSQKNRRRYGGIGIVGDVESERPGGLRSSPERRDDSSQSRLGGAVATTT